MLRSLSRLFKLSLSRKIYGLILLMLVSTLTVSYMAVGFQGYSRNVQHRIGEDNELIIHYLEIAGSIHLEVSGLHTFVMTDDTDFADQAAKQAAKTDRILSTLLKRKYDAHHKHIYTKLAGLKIEHSELKSLIDQAIEWKTNGGATAGAQDRLMARINARHAELQGTLEQLTQEEKGYSQAAIAKIDAAIAKDLKYIYFFSLLAMGVSLFVSAALRWNVTQPIVSILEAFKLIGAGNLTHHINIKTGDDMEDIGHEFNRMADGLAASRNENQRRLDEVSNLYKVSRTISSGCDVDEILRKVLDNTVDALKFSAGSIMLLNGDTDELEVRAAVGFDRKDESPAPKRLEVPLTSNNEAIGLITLVDKHDGEDFSDEDAAFLSSLSGQLVLAIKHAGLCEKAKSSSIMTIKALASALEAKDPYTHGHSQRVADYAVKLAARAGLDPEAVRGVETAAHLHDVGKIGIPGSLLYKSAALTPEETTIMRTHPLIGAGIIEHISFPWPGVLAAVKHHHERYDGQGYPDSLRGEEISIGSRILAIADVWDAMTSDRPYRSAHDVDMVLAHLKNGKGRQFDAALVDLFIEILELEKAGPAETDSVTSKA